MLVQQFDMCCNKNLFIVQTIYREEELSCVQLARPAANALKGAAVLGKKYIFQALGMLLATWENSR